NNFDNIVFVNLKTAERILAVAVRGHSSDKCVCCILTTLHTSDSWKGTALGFDWGEGTSCEVYSNSVINKLCRDLAFVDQMDSPENFVTEVRTVTLPKGVAPKDYAGPADDPVALLDALPAE
ncbi:MAG: hypothetical protein D3920_14350, partial [Candidatus Electrothrix sp. AW2]|nr:hypothetical protein [Candidatus Electrothrix gigas]